MSLTKYCKKDFRADPLSLFEPSAPKYLFMDGTSGWNSEKEYTVLAELVVKKR